MVKFGMCEFGDNIANSEKDSPCSNKAQYKIVSKENKYISFLLCKKHLKELKGIEDFEIKKL
jgi:hypothetical protein